MAQHGEAQLVDAAGTYHVPRPSYKAQLATTITIARSQPQANHTTNYHSCAAKAASKPHSHTFPIKRAVGAKPRIASYGLSRFDFMACMQPSSIHQPSDAF